MTMSTQNKMPAGTGYPYGASKTTIAARTQGPNLEPILIWFFTILGLLLFSGVFGILIALAKSRTQKMFRDMLYTR